MTRIGTRAWRRFAVRAIAATACTSALCLSSVATPIRDIQGAVSGSGDVLQLKTDTDGTILRAQEFRSAYMGSSPVTITGNRASFDSRFAWVSALSAAGTSFANILLAVAGFDLTFTIEDPLGVGYQLDTELLVRGYRTAFLESSTASDPYARASGTAFSAIEWDVDATGFVTAPGTLVPYSGGLTTDTTIDGTPINELATGTGSATLGHFVGTHTFTLRVGNGPSSNTTQVIQNNTLGETASRFGLDPLTTQAFHHALTPGPDGEPLENLGLFITVAATFDSPTALVPEPGVVALCVLAAAALGLRHGRGRNPRRQR